MFIACKCLAKLILFIYFSGQGHGQSLVQDFALGQDHGLGQEEENLCQGHQGDHTLPEGQGHLPLEGVIHLDDIPQEDQDRLVIHLEDIIHQSVHIHLADQSQDHVTDHIQDRQ